MPFLNDILRVLDVSGKEAERIMSDLQELAESRGTRRLVVKLPRTVRVKLDDNLGQAGSQEHLRIIRNILEEHFDLPTREAAYLKALTEIVRDEFLPTIWETATGEQRQEIESIMIGE